jgi:hypothetical protein
MKENKELKWDDPKQSARFIEVGERLLGDDVEEKLEDAMKRIAKAKRREMETSKTNESRER